MIKVFYIKLITNSMTCSVVVPCAHLSVPNDVTALTLKGGGDDAQYHEADR